MTNAQRLGKLIEARALILEVRRDVSTDEKMCSLVLHDFVNIGRDMKSVIDAFVEVRAEEMAQGMGVEL